jgi:chorismate mutase
MDNILKKIETELNSLSAEEKEKILIELRDGVDVIDKQIVDLLSKRTLHAVLIGRVKRSMNLPTYNPQREKDIAERISSYVEEPLSKEALIRIYERIIDESRAIQREELEKGNIVNISAKK